MTRFSGRTALVTGASGGIGAAVSRRLADESARVVMADVHERAAKEAAAHIGGSTVAIALDVTSEESVDEVFREISRQVGRVDVVINCAGIAQSAAFLDTTLQAWRHQISTNATGTFLVGKAAARAMWEHGGQIVNVGSIAGLHGSTGQAAYAASKAAVSGLTRVMAVELAPRGIRVNEIVPGPVETSLSRSMVTEESRAARISRLPVERFGSPEEIAAAAAFLASEDASYLTGASLIVDGGFTIVGIQ